MNTASKCRTNRPALAEIVLWDQTEAEYLEVTEYHLEIYEVLICV
jgi:hypothetical protein